MRGSWGTSSQLVPTEGFWGEPIVGKNHRGKSGEKDGLVRVQVKGQQRSPINCHNQNDRRAASKKYEEEEKLL